MGWDDGRSIKFSHMLSTRFSAIRGGCCLIFKLGQFIGTGKSNGFPGKHISEIREYHM